MSKYFKNSSSTLAFPTLARLPVVFVLFFHLFFPPVPAFKLRQGVFVNSYAVFRASPLFTASHTSFGIPLGSFAASGNVSNKLFQFVGTTLFRCPFQIALRRPHLRFSESFSSRFLIPALFSTALLRLSTDISFGSLSLPLRCQADRLILLSSAIIFRMLTVSSSASFSAVRVCFVPCPCPFEPA